MSTPGDRAILMAAMIGRYRYLRSWVSASVLLLLFFWGGLHATADLSQLPYRTDRLLIQPKPGTQRQQLSDFHVAHGLKLLKSFGDMGELQVLEVPSRGSVPGLVAAYQKSGLCQFAEPDYFASTFATPNDPKYLDGSLWGLERIDAAGGWDLATSANRIVVAVVDTGVRYTHEDLAANMWENPNGGGHGFNALTGANDPHDDNGHGTMVAGVLGAAGNNGIGVVGVAWEIQIMGCKAFDYLRIGSVSSCVAALDYARTNKASIVNASWGFGTNSLALSNAVHALREDGIILVAACGNSSMDVDVSPVYPACSSSDNVVSVAYTTREDRLAAASNYGATSVDLAAPGESIYSTFGATDTFYLGSSGSSFAAPHVCGSLALLREKYAGETHQEIITRLLLGTDPLPSLTGKCVTGGRLNLAKALMPFIRLLPLGFNIDGEFQLRIASTAGRHWVLERSADLKTWTPVFTNASAAIGLTDFTEPLPADSGARFYRTLSPP